VPDDAPGARPKRILIVDDEPHIRRLLAVRLEAEHFDVIETEDGASGLAALAAHSPDLVLLDLMMPGANGFEVLSRIRSNPRHKDVPVIILTAKGQDTDRELALAGGANDFVTKPFSPLKLIARIHQLLDGDEPTDPGGPPS
jgi:DNA-binding response OmpR family regulator